jgi:hypothetical protein
MIESKIYKPITMLRRGYSQLDAVDKSEEITTVCDARDEPMIAIHAQDEYQKVGKYRHSKRTVAHGMILADRHGVLKKTKTID